MATKKFGTAPVFFTAISTILGAILFLRFGFAVGTLGFWGVILIILLGHMVTIPTALAISELATNKRVLGGGEYFIISRSFGLNIGATIGLALYLSQAISVAFYVIAFTEAFEFFFNWEWGNGVWQQLTGLESGIPRQIISLPVMIGLAILILKKGASLGVKALYFVVAILIISLTLFFLGSTEHATVSTFGLANAQLRNSKDFFMVFAIIFPAFTGMTAGVGLSGDLKNPSKSIPLGTTLATIAGMIIYVFIVYKLALSASIEDLTNNQLIMAKIALGGAVVVPLGLAASTISSALGSIMVAPRTLQALSNDKSLPIMRLNNWLAKEKNGEPVNASLVTSIIALVFVALGNVDAVAEIISMFFMITYGSICLISFLNHFGSSPSYRPSFKSKWIISLAGLISSAWVMFKFNSLYSIVAVILLIFLYLYISYKNKERRGLQSIFTNAIFQMNRNIQVYLQKTGNTLNKEEWRPSAICISQDTFERQEVFRLLNWISYKYGFGTYLHLIQGYYSSSTVEQSEKEQGKIISFFEEPGNHVYIDTIISPSYTSAIAQAIQMPGVAGMENNMIIFDYNKKTNENLDKVIDNFSLVNAGKFDVGILASNGIIKKLNNSQIHVWIKSGDTENANLMIMLSFIIQGHPDWKKSNIKIFEICRYDEKEKAKKQLNQLLKTGRLPITEHNIEIIIQPDDISPKKIINDHSPQVALTIIGFTENNIKHYKEDVFTGYDALGSILFVHSHKQISIE